MDLKLPVDFERLPEFRMLCGELVANANANGKAQMANGKTEQAAVFIWMRLWTELAYQAQTTNRPGLMTGDGAELFRQSLGDLFSEDLDPLKVLERAGCVKSAGTEGWTCERFARMNGHLAGDFVSRETKGAAASALERNKHHIAQAAHHQAMLLAPELFKKHSGEVLTDSEINRCMVLIKTLDNCLKINSRKKGEYTEGLMVDAWSAVEKYSPEALREFYIWLTTNRDHPAVPKRTEQVLAKFEECFQMKG